MSQSALFAPSAAPASPSDAASSTSSPTRPSLAAPLVRSGCSIEVAFSVLGGRWKGVVLYFLFKQKRRFGELRRLLPNCTQRILTVQLRELERDGLVTRTVFPSVPPHVEYELTPLGRTLEPVLRSMGEWGIHFQQQQPDSAHSTAPLTPDLLTRCAE